MSIKNVIKKIDPERDYNLSTIAKEGIFPWTADYRTVRKLVRRDFDGEKMLKSVITGEGRALDYKIRGKHIIKFLEKYGPGLMVSIPRKETVK